jgi:hypothetical protein
MLISMSTSRIQNNKGNNRLQSNKSKIEGFFPREHAILAEYFDLQEKQPQQARAFDPHEITSEENNYEEAVEGIACRKSYGGRDYRAIDNAVARIALAPVRKNLPTWGGLGKDGAFHSRQSENESILPERGYRSDPVHVLSINWASSGPSYSWPLKYYISWIPYYERYVVTVSYDSPEVEGYLDLAIGDLSEGASVEKELKSVIVRHWDRDSMYLQGWEGVIDSGIVKDPWAWREEVSWGYNDDGEEIAFLEEEDDEE